ncbi:MAG TPA: hypothetical protein VEB43_09430 [Anaeromyxobacter sp.]|nr:hypothetical protein [Anaeromyxobacter sp.]
MILPLLAAALVAQASPDPQDPCAPISPGLADPGAAEAYEGVADEERAAGREESAVAAYRAALERDAGRDRARAALEELCAARRSDGAFTRGLERVRAGDCRGALPALDEARTAGDPAASLLAGVCRYQLGEDDAAAEALREAADDEETRASAELYLGLLALRGGRPGEASPLFRSAAADPGLAPVARALARDARREGRVVLSLLGEASWDSNADVAPGGGIGPEDSADGVGGGTALLTVAPWRERGPYVRGAFTLQEQARRDEFDLLATSLAAGLPLGPGSRGLLVEYGWDERRVGGAPYLSAHRLLAEGRAALREGLTAGAAYALRGETFRSAELEDDSGLRHDLQVDVTAAIRRARLTAGWQGGWNGARVEWRASAEHGPLLGLSAPLSPRARAVLELAYVWRRWREEDPDLDVRRRDAYVDAAARLELELADRWTAYLSVAGRRAFSNVPELRYARVVPTAGLSYTAGLY